MPYTPLEKQIINIKSITETLDSILGHHLIDLHGETDNTEVLFKTDGCKMYFFLTLIDLFSNFKFSLVDSEMSTGIDRIIEFAENPLINNPNVDKLKESITQFNTWLNEECEYEKIWLPSIEKEASLKVKRKEYLKICGNISKHCFMRLDRMQELLKKIFNRNGIELNDEKAIMILPEFYEWFHEHIMSYLSSYIIEMLNNIRWGIQEYLKPLFEESIISGDNGYYRYNYPEEIQSELGKHCFWDLMNEVRRGPYLKKFEIPSYKKERY